jgi:hypothetical protein
MGRAFSGGCHSPAAPRPHATGRCLTRPHMGTSGSSGRHLQRRARLILKAGVVERHSQQGTRIGDVFGTVLGHHLEAKPRCAFATAGNSTILALFSQLSGYFRRRQDYLEAAPQPAPPTHMPVNVVLGDEAGNAPA